MSRRRSSEPLGLASLSLGGDHSLCLGAPAGHAGKQGRPEKNCALQATSGSTHGTCNAVQAPGTGLEGAVYDVWCELHASQDPMMQEPPSLHKLAQSLAHRLGHEAGTRVMLRTCRNPDQSSCFARAAHSFIVVQREGQPSLIVDPSFRAQFHLGRSDDAYCSFLATVPPLFVGTLDVLEELVNTCAAAMAAAFSRQNMPTPPWRQGHVMLCRWRPQRYTDTLFTPHAATPRLLSPFASPAQQQKLEASPASPADPLSGTICSSHPEPHPQPLAARRSKLMPWQSSTLKPSTLKRASSKQADISAPPSHAIVIGFDPPRPPAPLAAHPPNPRTPGTKRPSQLNQRRCGSPHTSRHGQQACAFLAGCQPSTAAGSSNDSTGEATSLATKAVAAEALGGEATAAAAVSGGGVGRASTGNSVHSNRSAHAAAAAAAAAEGVAPAAVQPQPPAMGAANVRPAVLNTQAGPIVNVYPCSEPASLVQQGAGLLATQSLSHTASGLLGEAALQQQAQEEQRELAKEDSQQQPEQLEAQKQHHQKETLVHVTPGEAGACASSKEAGQEGQQLSQPLPHKAPLKRGCVDLLPPVYKVRLGGASSQACLMNPM
ncbi:hypothetical protein DUNSADRAFT_3634 [Dunaliella salina]|uniref:Uncharacterized protein n=1 Tax=Dunaliella salina TaxID=3046 RepID=A0ABQ7GTQ9_DUNSA|nr:hypothetical protein DUNSADRAFT_3634 [Dunaliella salina]|eukprot:KAF5837973.1 hypothetical protein DUNSADRAFT_3634 [Dunaliella salina]